MNRDINRTATLYEPTVSALTYFKLDASSYVSLPLDAWDVSMLMTACQLTYTQRARRHPAFKSILF